MGPRRLLLVAAGLSLCGPLLSARTLGGKSGESCPGIPSLFVVGPAARAPRGNGAGGRGDRMGTGCAFPSTAVPLAAPFVSGCSGSQAAI